MLDELSPHSIQAEQEVLGAVLFEKSSIAEVADVLEPEDFYRTPHQYIFEAFIELFRKGEPVDIIHVAEWMSDHETLDAAGGRPYLMELAMAVTTSGAIRHHAGILRNYSLRRKLQKMGRELVVVAQTESGTDALEFAQGQLLDVARGNDKQKDLSAKELAKIAFENIKQRLHCPNQVTGIPTGFGELDQYIGGLRPSKLIILGARPGMGKSGLALNIAVTAAVQHKKPVLFFSLEMEPAEMMERVLMSIAESRTHLGRLETAMNQVPDNLKIIDRPNLNVTQLRASIIKHKLEMGGLGLVVVDYLQLMKSKGGSRNEEVSNLSRELKLISREFKIPVLCLSQLSRKVEERDNKRPKKSDLRDSGSIEQDADTVILLYRDDYYNKDTLKANIAEVIIEKNRDGKLGVFDLAFKADIIKFMGEDSRREAMYDRVGEEENDH